MIDKNWDLIIEPDKKLFDLKTKEIKKYKDLLFLLVRRDLVAQYKQTILGPLWFIVQPILTTITFTFIFGGVAGISTDGLPRPLFYLTGITCWRYFSTALTRTSSTFRSNASLFGKVYFPRAIMPISITITNLVTFGIQLVLFLSMYAYFSLVLSFEGGIQKEIILFPLIIITMMLLGLGLGMTLSSLTSKYRDLNNLIAFGVQLLMYATPVIYPLSTIPEKFRFWILLNPMTPVIEAFRYMFLGAGSLNYLHLTYAFTISFVVFFVGLNIFNRTEKNFIDTV